MKQKAPLFLGEHQGHPLVFTGDGSLCTVGPPGTGKSRGVAVWNALAYAGSLLVTDPKGQLARWSAETRAKTLGQEVSILDPFAVTGWASSSVNPLRPVRDAVERGQGYRSEADRLAHVKLPDLPNAKDPYWRDGGRSVLVTVFLCLAALEPERCHLPGAHALLWQDHDALKTMLERMEETGEALGGALRQHAADLLDTMEARPKEFGIFLKEARAALSIYAADEPCGQAVMRDEVDFGAFMDGGMSVFLILPPELVPSHGRYLGLVASHAIHAIMKARGQGEGCFLLDEFANLGRLPGIISAVAQLREKGLRVWPFVQDIAQLDAVYGREDALSLRNQAEVLQVLGCRSLELSKFIEARAGRVTKRNRSFGMPDPTDPDAGPRESINDIGMPRIPVTVSMEMPFGKQILIRHGHPALIADLKLWRGG